MSEMPEDIMIAARAVADAVCPALPVDEQAAFVAAKWPIVARAIMAERERCVKIADEHRARIADHDPDRYVSNDDAPGAIDRIIAIAADPSVWDAGDADFDTMLWRHSRLKARTVAASIRDALTVAGYVIVPEALLAKGNEGPKLHD